MLSRAVERLAALRPHRDYLGSTRRPYRLMPDDFPETFARIGWEDEIREIYRANWYTVLRWIRECGDDALRLQRKAVSRRPIHTNRRSALPSYPDVCLPILREEGVEAELIERLQQRGFTAADAKAWLHQPHAVMRRTPWEHCLRGFVHHVIIWADRAEPSGQPGGDGSARG